MNEEVESMITAIGALCEIAGFMKKQLMEQGFTKHEAFRICKEFIMNQI